MYDNSSTENEFDPLCAQYETYTTARFIFITLATVIACLGTAANLLLMHIFSFKKAASTPATLYPTILAFLDFAICLEYLLLFGVDAIVCFLRVESLFVLYYMYIIPAYVASRVTQLAIPYMLIFATLERLVWTSGNVRSRFLLAMLSTSGRYFTAIISLLVCVALRLPTAFAIEVAVYPECEDFFRTMTTQPRAWTNDSEIYYFFDFHLMTIAQTLVPFIILFALNIVIIRKLTKTTQSKKELICDTGSKMDSLNTVILLSIRPVKSVSASVRSAIMTMVAIVASYLISNTLHLILTVMERSDHPILHDTEDPLLSSTFHTFFSDMVSFTYMFTSAIRLLIYFICNATIRADILKFFGTSTPTPL
uniref:G_PROTEIN_RECEP_F1_2 domain-containing protein n=1 Tax=Haemonchus contortus TaxID=6289 RepID=A0A7I4YVS5_HAECO|nr:Protein FRPR-7 [Haemonchus contortus]